MRRAAFGARPNEIQQKVNQGLEATVDELVNYDQVEEDPSVPVAPTTAQGSSDITASQHRRHRNMVADGNDPHKTAVA